MSILKLNLSPVLPGLLPTVPGFHSVAINCSDGSSLDVYETVLVFGPVPRGCRVRKHVNPTESDNEPVMHIVCQVPEFQGHVFLLDANGQDVSIDLKEIKE